MRVTILTARRAIPAAGLPEGKALAIKMVTDSQAATRAIGRGRSSKHSLLNSQLQRLSEALAGARVLLRVCWVQRAQNWKADTLSHPEDFRGVGGHTHDATLSQSDAECINGKRRQWLSQHHANLLTLTPLCFAALPFSAGFARRTRLAERMKELNRVQVETGVHNRGKVRMTGPVLSAIQGYLRLVHIMLLWCRQRHLRVSAECLGDRVEDYVLAQALGRPGSDERPAWSPCTSTAPHTPATGQAPAAPAPALPRTPQPC